MQFKITNKLFILFIILLDVVISLYLIFNKASNTNFFIEIKILTAFVIMFVHLLPTLKQHLRK